MDLDDLLKKFDQMDEDIEKDVSTIVRNNTLEMTKKTIKNEFRRFDKGYWTGTLARNTKTHKEDSLHYKTIPGTEYAMYLNYGTRYMSATWFLRDSFNMQKKQLQKDLDRLMKG